MFSNQPKSLVHRRKLTSPLALAMIASAMLIALIVPLAVLLPTAKSYRIPASPPPSDSISPLIKNAATIVIPAPKPHDRKNVVAHERSWVVQTGRKDPYNPAEDRKLAISLFMPLSEKNCTAYCDDTYMPDKTAKASNSQFFGNEGAGVFEGLGFQSCCAASIPIDTKGMRVMVLEPGLGTSRLMYNQLARQLSSLGMAVVTIDHPFEAPIVEFEDRIGVKAAPAPAIEMNLDAFTISTEWNSTMIGMLNTRRADIHFVLDQMSEPNFLEKVMPKLKFTGPLNTTSVQMVGHGFGGSVATSLTANDASMVWSINLSGTGPDPQILHETYDYTVFFGREGHTRKEDPNWLDSLKSFKGAFTEWTFKKAGLMDYTDLPLVASLSKQGVKAQGTGEDGAWAFHCTSCFLEAYVRDTLQGEEGELGVCMKIRQCHNFRPYEQ